MIQLVLFDIDGTLIRSGGAGVKAFERTFLEQFGLPEATRTLNFAGRTDVSLVRECFTQHKVPATPDNFDRFFSRYPLILAELLEKLNGAVCRGIPELLHDLRSVPNPPIMGLLTGNVRRGAELKLRRYDLWEHFVTGAFADDHEDRNCIAAKAKERGEHLLGRKLSGEEIVVIGDTPHDITCGKSIGAKVAAVATGTSTCEELEKFTPTWAVEHAGHLTARQLLGRAPA